MSVLTSLEHILPQGVRRTPSALLALLHPQAVQPAAPAGVTLPDTGADAGDYQWFNRGLPQGGGEQFGGPAMVAAGSAAATTPAAPAKYDRSTDGKPGFFRVLDDVLGGMTISEARDYEHARELDRRMEPYRQAMQASLADWLSQQSPEQQALYLTNKDKWAESAAKGLEPVTLTGGQTLVRPGRDPYTAPTMGVSGDYGYTQTPTSFTIVGQRPPTYVETSEDSKRKADIANAIATLHETATHNRNTEAADRSRIGLESQRVNIERSKANALTGGDGLGSMSDEQLFQALIRGQ